MVIDFMSILGKIDPKMGRFFHFWLTNRVFWAKSQILHF